MTAVVSAFDLVVLAASGTGATALALAIAAAVGLVVWVLVAGHGRNADLQSALETYGTISDSATGGTAGELTSTSMVQHVVNATGRLAERSGRMETLETRLEQAALPIRAAEAVTIYIATIVAGALIGILGGPLAMIGLAVLAAVAPPMWLSHRRTSRVHEFQSMLPAVLNILAGSLRSGYSFIQAMEVVSKEAIGPMGVEMKRVFSETRLGRKVEDALEDCASRMESVDLKWVVLAVRIQREVGGNLAEILDNVSETMAERDRFRGEVRALTAEGRLSSVVVGAMPLVLGVMLSVINPDYISKLFEETAGMVAVGIGLVMSGIGFVWVRKIVSIEV